MTIPTGMSSASTREYVLRTDNVYVYYNEVDNLKNNKTMKRIYLFVLSALMMLMSTSAMAQSETVKGDVNGDGVVDVADIAAVIKIMTDKGSIEKKYYWYVGQENPANMTSISPIVTDNTSLGWRLIGTTIPTYTANNVLWDGQVNEIVFDNYNDVTAYLALPNNTIKLRDGLGNDVTSELLSLGTKNINGVNYYIYQNKLGSSNYMQYSLDLVLF